MEAGVRVWFCSPTALPVPWRAAPRNCRSRKGPEASLVPPFLTVYILEVVDGWETIQSEEETVG